MSTSTPRTWPITEHHADVRRATADLLGTIVERLIAPVDEWRQQRIKDEAANLPLRGFEDAIYTASPYFQVDADVQYAFDVSFTLVGSGGATIGFRDQWNRWCHFFENPRFVNGEGRIRVIVPLRTPHRTKVNLSLVSHQPLRDLAVVVYARTPPVTAGSEADTCLPHWSRIERALHRLCKRSRLLNTIVASYEMRHGREELLSVPQYVSLCPTGQCNAL